VTVEQRFVVECLMWRVVGGLVEDLSGFETRYCGDGLLCGLLWMYWLWL